MRLRRPRSALIAGAILAITLLYLHQSSGSWTPLASAVPAVRLCPEPPLLEDILVVLRTGATEALEKLPNHFDTTLTCVPDYVIYSDAEEYIKGHHTYDVLNEVNEAVKREAPEFKLYEQLRTNGRAGLNYEIIFGSGPTGALENPGWKLDKWKFLPMVRRALLHRPTAKWFVFVESDTYMLWQNVVEYLSKFNSSEAHYLGKHMYIGSVLFAHGGSGFILSNPAAAKVAAHWKSHEDEYDRYTLGEWAGDMVLGKVLKDVNIDLFWAFPHLQGDSLTTIDWNVSKVDRQPWCYAPLTFHHMNKAEFGSLWEFEQLWLRRNTAVPKFRDIFKAIILPRLRPDLGEWDNISGGIEYSDEATAKLSDEKKRALSMVERKAQTSFDSCREACESTALCIQFSHAPGKCLISSELRLGNAADSQCLEYSRAAGRCIKTTAANNGDSSVSSAVVRSGWIMSRVSQYVDELDQSCTGPEEDYWVT
ncbi:hypothetical protein JX265_012889 [Neoarthrinium moseri]|uniref:N-acetylgalactosaminide beta-1,3-galactosyltransferase n=1 Tax=Neoarthrinium moseri TaxID=1658444 RepID=A0A9Q0AJB6_9PEZI|nr:hypothetical protein JX265_012889 [Neoarthrinium moseri]